MTQGSAVQMDPGPTIRQWWAEKVGCREEGTPRASAARAFSARLRHGSAVEVVCEPAVQDLARDLGMRAENPDALVHLIRLVRLLAEVRVHDPAPLARLLGGGDTAALSVSRFQHVMRAEGEDLTSLLRRAVEVAGRRCNISALGRDLLQWQSARSRWCFQYFHTDDPSAGIPADEQGEVIEQWWDRMIRSRDEGTSQASLARGFSARVRRGSPLDVLCEPAVQDLARDLGLGAERADDLVRLVRILAEIRSRDKAPLARLLGPRDKASEPVLSKFRFQCLVRARGDDLTALMRRAIGMAGRSCNVSMLGRDVLRWDATRRLWWFQYYQTEEPASLMSGDTSTASKESAA